MDLDDLHHLERKEQITLAISQADSLRHDKLDPNLYGIGYICSRYRSNSLLQGTSRRNH